MASQRLGEILVERGIVSRDSWARAVELESAGGGPALLQLVALGTSGEALVAALQGAGVPVATEALVSGLPQATLDRVPREMAASYFAVPVMESGGSLSVALADPFDTKALEEIGFFAQAQVVAMAIEPTLLARVLAQHYGIRIPAAATAVPTGSAPSPAPEEIVDLFRAPTPEPVVPLTKRKKKKAPAPPPAAVAPPPPAPEPDDEDDDFEVDVEEPDWFGASEGTPRPKPEGGPAAPAGPWKAGGDLLGSSGAPPAPPPGPVAPAAPPPAGNAVDPELAEYLDFTVAWLRGVEARDEVADAALSFLVRSYPRAALFAVRGGAIRGWMAGGDVDEDRVSEMVASQGTPSVLWRVVESGRTHSGPLPPDLTADPLIDALGSLPRYAVIQPVNVGPRPAVLLYGDTTTSGSPPIPETLLAQLAREISDALNALILKKKLG